MAVKLFTKKDEVVVSEVVDIQFMNNYLERGYTLTEEELLAPTEEEADTNNSGVLSPAEIRAAAEKAGIEGYDKKQIKTLKKELGYADKED